MDFRLDQSLGFIMNKVNAKLKNEFSQQLKEYDITTEQWAVLNRLWEKEGVTPKELSVLIYKDKPNTNRILEKLAEKGYVSRLPHPSDKRAFQVFLTGTGRALREVLVPKAIETLTKATRGIHEDKVREMKVLLEKIFSNLD